MASALQKLAHEPSGGVLVTQSLHEHLEHAAVLVHSAPEPVLHACDLHRDLAEVPLVAGAEQPSANAVYESLAELQRPLPHGRIADDDAADG